MKRLLFITLFILLVKSPYAQPREFYQLSIYHFASDSQGLVIEEYLREALVPALHRASYTNIGVFRAIANDTAVDKRLYVFIPFSQMEQIDQLPVLLEKDALFMSAGTAYRNATYLQPPYSRMEIILLKAFPLAPQMQLPRLTAPKEERVYELRSYESATEKIFANKVHMFNEGDEIGLFKRLGFNAVFYSSVMAGSRMPNLMYMTCFENRADRDAHWKQFSQDPYWKKLSGMPEYQKNVSKAEIFFLRPVAYSDF